MAGYAGAPITDTFQQLGYSPSVSGYGGFANPNGGFGPMTASQGMPSFVGYNPPMSAAQGAPAGFDWGSLIGGLGALGSGFSMAGAQNNSASLAQQYAQAASQLPGYGLGTGPGGVSATGNPMGGGGQINFGGFNPAYQGLAGLAGGNIGTAGGIGAPMGLNPALSGAFGTAAGALGGFNPLASGMAGNSDLFAASNLANQAGSGFSNNVTQMYNALQGLQSPANINAANSLGNSLFGRGMLGSSSGGILSQQFGQGLAQQSAANAAAAQGLGLQAMTGSANAATGLSWMGSNALNSAFSNFGNASMLAPNVQASYMNPALAGITGAGNLTNTGLGLYNAGLQGALGQNLASSRAGFLGTTNANSPNQQSPYGQLLGNLFGGLAANGPNGGQSPLSSILGSNGPGGGVNGWLNSLFGGGGGGVTGAVGDQVLGGLGPLASFATPGIGGLTTSALSGGVPDWLAGTGLSGGGVPGFSAAGGAAAGTGADVAGGIAPDLGGGEFGAGAYGAEEGLPAGYATGGSSAGAGGLGALGSAGLAAALFGGQYALFNAQSANTPGQQYRDLQGQLSNPNTPATARDIYQFAANQWNPAAQNFNQFMGGPAGMNNWGGRQY